jgi:hypothetical protein
MREAGFYWVNIEYKGWIICEWYNNKWFMAGISSLAICKAVMQRQTEDDYLILEIDERRIVREESKLDQCIKMLKELTYDPRFPEGGIDLNHCCRDGH